MDFFSFNSTQMIEEIIEKQRDLYDQFGKDYQSKISLNNSLR